MPGDKDQSISYMYHYTFGEDSLNYLPIATFKDQSLSIYATPAPASARDDDYRATTWLGDKYGFYFSLTSRDMKKVDVWYWDFAANEKKVVIEERSNTYIDLNGPALVKDKNELIFWSERDGWGHFYLYGTDGTLKR
jgi:hypothetical protein